MAAGTDERTRDADQSPEEAIVAAVKEMREVMDDVDLTGVAEAVAAHTRPAPTVQDANRVIHRLLSASAKAFQAEPQAVLWALEHTEDDRLVDSLLVALPRSSGDEKWDDVLGPFTTWSGGVKRLDDLDTRQGLDRRRDRYQVLGCQARDRTWLYPLFQFMDGDVIDGLPDVLKHLVPATDGWTAGLWLKTPNTRLEGQAPHTWLRERCRLLDAVTAARHQADEWSARSEDRVDVA